MLGLYHVVMRSMVVENYGEAVWKMILKKSEFGEKDVFQKSEKYPDETTNKLLSVVGRILGKPTTEVLELLGVEFLHFLMKHGHKKSIKSLGGDFPALVNNLDSLHALLKQTTMRGCEFDAPSFRCEEVGMDGSATLHYYSSRGELMLPFVMGLLKAIGEELFRIDLKCEVIDFIKHKTFTHVSFQLSGVLQPENLQKVATTRRRSSHPAEIFSKELLISAHDMCTICPFHITFDKSLKIKQCGSNIQKMSPDCSLVGKDLRDMVKLVTPTITLCYEDIVQFPNAVYELQINDGKTKPKECVKSVSSLSTSMCNASRQIYSISLRGQMIAVVEEGLVLFLGAPLLNSIHDMQSSNLFLSDIPIYDVTREVMLFKQQIIAEGEISKKLDLATNETAHVSDALEKEKEITDALLYQMLPQKVADTLRDGGTVKSERFENVTIFFSDIVSFTAIASSAPPADIVAMLNELYSKCDQLTNQWDVFKVETIGDAYMVVGGAPEETTDHAEKVANFAIDMVLAASQVKNPTDSTKSIQVRTGIHSGPVCAGVVGNKMPRYCLSGETVIIANQLQERGCQSSIHISSTTHSLLCEKPGYEFEERGNVSISSDMSMMTRFLIATPKRQLHIRDNSNVPSPEERKRSKTFKFKSCSCQIL